MTTPPLDTQPEEHIPDLAVPEVPQAEQPKPTIEDHAEEIDSEFPEETWLTDESLVDEINTRWRQVIEWLMAGKNIYEAYGHAYDIDVNTPRGYNKACANGSRLIRNDRFKKLWNKVLDESGFNDQMADSRLLDLIINPGYEAGDRFKAIKHYNELRGRVIKNIDVKSNGKEIQSPAIMPVIKPRNAPTDQEETASSS